MIGATDLFYQVNKDFLIKTGYQVPKQDLKFCRLKNVINYKNDYDLRDEDTRRRNIIFGEAVEDYFLHNGFIINPLSFSKTNPYSFCYDITCPKTNIRVELKGYSANTISFRCDNDKFPHLGNSSNGKRIITNGVNLTNAFKKPIADIIVFCNYQFIPEKNCVKIKPTLIIDNDLSLLDKIAMPSMTATKTENGITYQAPHYIGLHSQKMREALGTPGIKVI